MDKSTKHNGKTQLKEALKKEIRRILNEENDPKIISLPEKDDEENEDIDDVVDDYEKIEDDGIEDDDELDKKALPSDNTPPTDKLAVVVKTMKKLAKEFTAAKEAGDKETQSNITSKLKDLNKQKLSLEKEVEKSLGNNDDEDELDESIF